MFALALFLAGTHYCLVGGVAARLGARISCMAPVSASSGSCHAAPGSSHCAQHASVPAVPGHPAKARSATPPCCVALAPVLAAAGTRTPADALAPVLPASPEVAVAAPALASFTGYRVACDAGPPPLHPRAPLSARAPPLA